MAERTCLIVDDSKIVRKVMRKIIEPMGFNILEAEDGQQALDAFKEGGIELVMLDWNMPVMNGMEFLLKLRADASITQPMVVFCTTENEFSKIQEALMNGANEYVMKPFDHETLQIKLQLVGFA